MHFATDQLEKWTDYQGEMQRLGFRTVRRARTEIEGNGSSQVGESITSTSEMQSVAILVVQEVG